MRIAQLSSGTGLNGAVRHCYDLTCLLAEEGQDVLLVHRPGAWISRQPLPARVERLETSFRRTPYELRRIANCFREWKLDVSHSHTSSSHFFGVLQARLFGFRNVATCHMPMFQPHWWWNDRVIAPSASAARFQRWINLVSSKRIDIVHCFVDPAPPPPQLSRSQLRGPYGIPDSSFLITVVGAVCKRKAQEVLMQAVPTLLGKNVDAHVVLIGGIDPDYAEKIQSEIDENELKGRVHLLGQRADVGDWLHASDCVCLPSRKEVTPLSLLEAMAHGVPVVATRVGGVAECVRDGIDGLLVKKDSVEQLGDALLKLALQPDLRHRMGQAARQHVQAEFSPQICVNRILETYRNALHSGRSLVA